MKLIDKDAVVARIEEEIKEYSKAKKEYPTCEEYYEGALDVLKDFRDNFLNTLEVKEIETTKTPKHSYFETIYHCGAEPIWKVGDILATYECYSDREGEYVYGEVIDVKNGENDWIYTMKGDFGAYEDIYEKELISQEAYKKNK